MLFHIVCQKLAHLSACRQSFYGGNYIAHTAAERDREVLLSAIGFGCFPILFLSLFLTIQLYFGKIQTNKTKGCTKYLFSTHAAVKIDVSYHTETLCQVFPFLFIRRESRENRVSSSFKVNILKPLPCFHLPSICFQGNRRRSRNQ